MLHAQQRKARVLPQRAIHHEGVAGECQRGQQGSDGHRHQQLHQRVAAHQSASSRRHQRRCGRVSRKACGQGFASDEARHPPAGVGLRHGEFHAGAG